MNQKPRPQKHIPQRTCVACRIVRPKRELVRIVRTPEGNVAVDETGKRNGRGAYLCSRYACWEKALTTGLLNQALRTNLTADVKAQLTEYAANF
jgi:hypothetical protein